MLARLTDTAARNAKGKDKMYKLSDGGGLYLLVKPSGARLWRYRYRIRHTEKLLALGAYPHVGLQRARELHAEARALVARGVDPSAKRKADRLAMFADAGNTFELMARSWIEENRSGWSEYYARQVQTILSSDVFPHIGELPIKEIETPHLFAIVKKVEARKAATVAILIRQWCFAIFRHAKQRGAADDNPAVALRGAIKRPEVEHKRALKEDEIAALLAKISTSNATPQVAIALRLLLLTFVRPSELRNATWREFDLENRTWQIPKERMKMRDAHVVPLSRQAADLLQTLRDLNVHNRPQLFPNIRDPKRNMSITTLNRCLERLGYAGTFSAHGFRATASTFLNESRNRYRPEAIERQLAHRERNKVRGAYNHAKYLDERRSMMQDWADHLDSLSAPKQLLQS